MRLFGASGAIALLAALTLSADAQATQAIEFREPPKADTTCSAKAARVAEPGEVASHPGDFAGQCVQLKGYWRDTGFYPSRGEAAQPDALSVTFLDERRIGLYLSDKDVAAAPKGPAAAEVIGRVWMCEQLTDAAKAADSGYCHYKHGAFLAVTRIGRAK